MTLAVDANQGACGAEIDEVWGFQGLPKAVELFSFVRRIAMTTFLWAFGPLIHDHAAVGFVGLARPRWSCPNAQDRVSSSNTGRHE